MLKANSKMFHGLCEEGIKDGCFNDNPELLGGE